MTRGKSEQRTIPFSALSPAGEGATVPVDRFLPPDHPAYAGHWASPPRRWDDLPETRLLAKETRALVVDAIDNLPASERAVMMLRDVQGLDAREVCDLLNLSEGNQRVLLHRARAKVRAALETYFDKEAA